MDRPYGRQRIISKIVCSLKKNKNKIKIKNKNKKKFGYNINYKFQNSSSVNSIHKVISKLHSSFYKLHSLFINSPEETITQPFGHSMNSLESILMVAKE